VANKGVPRKRNSLIYGWGINDSISPAGLRDYTDSSGVFHKLWIDPVYKAWRGAISRCKSAATHKRLPNYIGVEISEEWKSFESFKSWALANGFDPAKVLDKDIVGDGSLYSPTTCCFVSTRVNNFLVGHKLKNSLPLGVSLDKDSGKYVAQVEFMNKCNRLGRFNNMWEAHLVYCRKKLELSYIVINEEQVEDYIATALTAKLQKKVDEAEILYQQSLI